MAIYFKQDEGRGKELFEWWQGLDVDRGARATLRRASSLTDVALTPAYQRLCQRMGAADWRPWELDRFALVVGVLAHIKTHDERKPAKAMGQARPGEERAPVSELRFLRLLDSPDSDALFSGMRRVLPLMGSVNVIALANDLMHWADEDGRVKKDWAYTYDWPEKATR